MILNQKNLIISLIVLVIITSIGFIGYREYDKNQRLDESEKLAKSLENRVVDIDSLEEEQKQDEKIDNQEQTPIQGLTEGEASNQSIDAVKTKGNFQGFKDYKSSGDVQITELGDNIIIEFQDNFEFSGAPDPFVYISANNSDSVNEALNLGALQENNGRQAYQISKAEFQKYSSKIVIWCQAYSEYLGGADLF